MARRRRFRLIPSVAPLALAAGAASLAALAGCNGPASEPAETPAPNLAPRGAEPIQASADSWVLSTDRWDASHRGTHLGNGLLGQQIGPAGIGSSAGKEQPAFLAGHYESESLVALPSLLPLRISRGLDVYGADPARVKKYHQELRLKEGILHTSATWDCGAGEVGLEFDAAALRQQPDVALLSAKIENRSRDALTVGTGTETAAQAGEHLPGGFHRSEGGVEYEGRLVPLDAPDLQPASAGSAGWQLPAGKTVRFALVTRVSSGAGKRAGALAALPGITASQVNAWLEGHRVAWAKLWAADLEIDGDAEAQQVLRACRYYLLSSIRAESDAGVPPMGLSANAFSGHVFWDMDSWMLPAVLPQNPELARAMLEYRFRTLDGAKANAKTEQLSGASYAWESAATGREALVGSIYTHGRHVTGDVALAMKQYFAATGDRAWLATRAWPVLQPTADNWVARAKPDGSGYVVRGVTTPDENAGRVDQSAWTHQVARVNLEFAGEAARTLGKPANPKWAQVAKGLTFLRDPQTTLILPYRGFTEKTKAKQADVLLLVHPGGLDLPPDELGKMYDYYAPRVIPIGPAMTDAIHAVVAARLGRTDEAEKRFRDSYRPFVRPPFHLFSEKRTRDNLCFLTGAAGVLEAALYGFAGLELAPDPAHPDRPKLAPHLPATWKALRLRHLQWRGKTWDVEITPGTAPTWKPVP